MNLSLFRVLQFMAVIGLWFACCGGAQAQSVYCEAGGTPHLDFGTYLGWNFDATSVGYGFRCKNQSNALMRARVCIKVHPGSGGEVGNHRSMLHAGNPSAFMRYQLYQDPARTLVWGISPAGNGSNTALLLYSPWMEPGQTSEIQGTPMYGRLHVAAGDPVVAGDYHSIFGWEVSYRGIQEGVLEVPGHACDPGLPGTQQMPVNPFTVRAKSEYYCKIITDPVNIYFGNQQTLGEHYATGDLQLQCGQGVGYKIVIDQGVHGHHNKRWMRGSSGEEIEYQLFTGPQYNQVWGDDGGIIPGDAVGGQGTGTAQSHTIYARILPQPTPQPGLYTDTAVITVYY